ncbi:phosphomevalonate kinase [Streptococcus pacificus]|uniref:phosphomevalonate kinase n=1 Tax=Streptococcus pacificus TaxID=2740577 RepID=A0ABS0ZI39_9STRE|nr:phosphomevalonate kinase [Streptococcus pacificus]MBJ8325669.1 phosphomevalonate kinase [Streptococcus pacificus]
MIKTTTCGKLYLAGEYAILNPNQVAIIKDIPIYMTAQVTPSEHYSLSSDMFNYSVDLTDDANYALIQESIKTMANYLELKGKVLTPFSLKINGKMEKEGKKIGIGSSGSVTVLTLKALALFYQLHLTKEELFKLAVYTLLKKGDNGSMGDIACIVYESLIYYRSFDRQRVKKWLLEVTLEELLEKDWGFTIKPVKTNLSFTFLVGWTRQPAISSQMIKKVQASIDNHFLSTSKKEVNHLYKALETGDKAKTKESISLLSQLLETLHPSIYSPKLKKLKNATHQLDAVAKSSGAGGGDSGIALVFDEESTLELIKRWQKENITVLYQEKMRGFHDK